MLTGEYAWYSTTQNTLIRCYLTKKPVGERKGLLANSNDEAEISAGEREIAARLVSSPSCPQRLCSYRG